MINLHLWGMLERYTAFRYSLKMTPYERITELSNDKDIVAIFNEIIDDHTNKNYFIELRNKKEDKIFEANSFKLGGRLDIEKPSKFIKALYQIRCNITHRGKEDPNNPHGLARNFDIKDDREYDKFFSDFIEKEFIYYSKSFNKEYSKGDNKFYIYITNYNRILIIRYNYSKNRYTVSYYNKFLCWIPKEYIYIIKYSLSKYLGIILGNIKLEKYIYNIVESIWISLKDKKIKNNEKIIYDLKRKLENRDIKILKKRCNN